MTFLDVEAAKCLFRIEFLISFEMNLSICSRDVLPFHHTFTFSEKARPLVGKKPEISLKFLHLSVEIFVSSFSFFCYLFSSSNRC